MNAIGSYDSGSDDEPPAKRQCTTGPKAPGKVVPQGTLPKAASPAGKPPMPKASGPPVTQDIKPLEQAKRCKDLASAADILSFIQSCGMSVLKNGAASCHVLAEIANRLDEANKPHWAGTSQVKSLVMTVKAAIKKEGAKVPIKSYTLADGLFGIMYLHGSGKDESTKDMVRTAGGKWAAEIQENKSMPNWPTEAFVRAAWCLSNIDFLQVKMERKTKELAKDQPLIKELLELWMARVSTDKAGDLIIGMGTMIKLPEMIRLAKDLQRDTMAKVVLCIPHMEPWQILAVAAACSKLEGPAYGLNPDGPMQAIRKRVPKLREVMPEANTEWLNQVLQKSAEISDKRKDKEEHDAHKGRRWNKEEADEYRKNRHWTAKNAAYFLDTKMTKVTPYQTRHRQ